MALKRMSVFRGQSVRDSKQLSTPVSTPAVPDEKPDDAKIEEMYIAVLDHQLIPPNVKESLIKSQSIDKKWQTVQMHKQLFAASGWGDKENKILSNIQKSKNLDIHDLVALRAGLSSESKQYMNSFLDNDGVSILLKCAEQRLHKKPATELDIAILYEIFSCFKSIMNNSTGMDGFLSVEGSVEMIARSLRFDFKTFTLLVFCFQLF